MASASARFIMPANVGQPCSCSKSSTAVSVEWVRSTFAVSARTSAASSAESVKTIGWTAVGGVWAMKPRSAFWRILRFRAALALPIVVAMTSSGAAFAPVAWRSQRS